MCPTGLPLFEPEELVVAREGSAPQQAAAEWAKPRARSQVGRILEALRLLGPLTREEISRHTGIRERALCARLRLIECPDPRKPALLQRPPLVRKLRRADVTGRAGYVFRDGDEHAYRKARSGIPVYVYDLTPEGRRL